jgi:hypothetical protein
MDASKLKSLDLFSSLSDDELEPIAQWTDEIEIETGHHLIRKDGFSYEFFVILEGTAEAMDGDIHLADMTAGDFFGEIGIGTAPAHGVGAGHLSDAAAGDGSAAVPVDGVAAAVRRGAHQDADCRSDGEQPAEPAALSPAVTRSSLPAGTLVGQSASTPESTLGGIHAPLAVRARHPADRGARGVTRCSASAASGEPHLRLFAASDSIVLDKYGTEPVRLGVGAYLSATGADFELLATRSYGRPIESARSSGTPGARCRTASPMGGTACPGSSSSPSSTRRVAWSPSASSPSVPISGTASG